MVNSKKELKKKIEKLGWWYQNFNLNGILTNTDTPDYPEIRWKLIEKYIPNDLSGKTVLDLGCNAGWFAIKMKERGADYVLGVEVLPNAIKQARFVSEYFNMSIEYLQMNTYEFILKNQRMFDYVLFLGLFYHLRYPLLVLDKVAEVTREKMYFQTVITGKPTIHENDTKEPWDKRQLDIPDDFEDKQFFDHPDYPKMYFIEKEYGNDYTNWWFCNETCALAMLRSAGFKNIIKSGGDTFICDPPKAQYLKKKAENISYLISRIPPLYTN